MKMPWLLSASKPILCQKMLLPEKLIFYHVAKSVLFVILCCLRCMVGIYTAPAIPGLLQTDKPLQFIPSLHGFHAGKSHMIKGQC